MQHPGSPLLLQTHTAHTLLTGTYTHIYTPLGNLLLLLAHGNRPCHLHTLLITSPNSHTHTCAYLSSPLPPSRLVALSSVLSFSPRRHWPVWRLAREAWISWGQRYTGSGWSVSSAEGVGRWKRRCRGKEGGVNCTWVAFVMSMWYHCQPKVHSKFVFKLVFVSVFFSDWNVLYQKYNDQNSSLWWRICWFAWSWANLYNSFVSSCSLAVR